MKVTYSGTGNNSQLAYDALGGLVSIVETVRGTTASTKQFVRTPGQMLEARDANSAVTAQYFGLGQTLSGSSYYYTKDHLGAVRDVTNSTGIVQKQYACDPYGVPTATGSGAAADFQYAGYYYHAASGLNLTQNRAYSSSLGRFINRDPIGENGGINLYAYAGNGPIGFSDPSGLDFTAVQIGSALGGAIGGVGGLVGGAVLGGAVGAVVGGILVGGGGLLTAGGYGLILGGGGGIGAGAIVGVGIGGAFGAGAGYGAGSIVGGAIGGLFSPCHANSSDSPDWRLSPHKSPTKWSNQLSKGNWTPAKISDLLKTGQQSNAVNKVNPGVKATQYFNPSTGEFIVQEENGKIIQVSRPGFAPNPSAQ